MINLKRLLLDSRTCKALTGMTPPEFETLAERFKIALYVEQKNRPGRKRAVGGGRPGKLPTALEKLAFILMYLKIYPTFDVLAVMTNRSRSKCCESVKQWLPILEKVLGHACVLPKRRVRSVEEFLQVFSEAKDVFIDGAERPVQRPKKVSKCRKLYSGKKKRCSRKTVIIADENRYIGVMIATKSGRRHDKRLWDKAHLFHTIPKDVTVWGDTGFQGMAKTHKNSMIPYKRSKGRPLTDEQKTHNRVVSSLRCVVEHAIGGYKRFKSSADIYRNKRPNLDDQFHLVSAGLWNVHLQHLQTQSQS